MREIKFRGWDEDNNKWVYGSYVLEPEVIGGHNYIGVDNIIPSEVKGVAYPVHEMVIIKPETLGQYTGLKDKNGKEIYEGDIVEEINTLGGIGEVELKYEVSWENTRYILKGINNNNHINMFEVDNNKMEIVGTKYDVC